MPPRSTTPSIVYPAKIDPGASTGCSGCVMASVRSGRGQRRTLNGAKGRWPVTPRVYVGRLTPGNHPLGWSARAFRGGRYLFASRDPGRSGVVLPPRYRLGRSTGMAIVRRNGRYGVRVYVVGE